MGSGTLEIKKAEKSDQGLYTCLASNEKGNTTSNAYLSIDSLADRFSLSNSVDNLDNIVNRHEETRPENVFDHETDEIEDDVSRKVHIDEKEHDPPDVVGEKSENNQLETTTVKIGDKNRIKGSQDKKSANIQQ